MGEHTHRFSPITRTCDCGALMQWVEDGLLDASVIGGILHRRQLALHKPRKPRRKALRDAHASITGAE